MTTKTKVPPVLTVDVRPSADQLLKAAADRAAWRAQNNSTTYLADVKFWREQVTKVAADEGQTLDEADQMQQLIDRRDVLSWEAFDRDVATARFVNEPRSVSLLSEEYEKKAAELERDFAANGWAHRILTYSVNPAKAATESARLALQSYAHEHARLTKVNRQNTRLFGPAASAFEGENAGLDVDQVHPRTSLHMGW